MSSVHKFGKKREAIINPHKQVIWKEIREPSVPYEKTHSLIKLFCEKDITLKEKQSKIIELPLGVEMTDIVHVIVSLPYDLQRTGIGILSSESTFVSTPIGKGLLINIVNTKPKTITIKKYDFLCYLRVILT